MSSQAQPAGNYYDKYHTRNPLARALMSGFLRAFDELATFANADSAMEIGCGEGELSIRLAKRGICVRGYDIAADAVDEAKRRAAQAQVDIPFALAGIEELTNATPAPLVICCEVLEHVEDPVRALHILAKLTERYLLVSVPREPIWRVLNVARGKYLADLGNTPGHVNHWSKTEFVRVVEGAFSVVEIRTPLPWTMLLCKPK